MQVAKPTLVFSGTVTAVDQARYIVAFRVERVWNGELRRESTFFVAPVVEGAQASSFHAGTRYLVAVYGTVRIFNAEDAGSAAVPTPTLFVAFGCKWKETAEADHLERLGLRLFASTVGALPSRPQVQRSTEDHQSYSAV